MTKVIIVSVEGADYFILNGTKRPRSYEAVEVKLLAEKQGVKIIPVQRSGIALQDTIIYDEYLINGEVPESQEDCISALNEIVFKKGGGNGAGVVNNRIIPMGEALVFKRENETPNALAVGDYVIRILLDKVVQGVFIGSDEYSLESYEVDTIANI